MSPRLTSILAAISLVALIGVQMAIKPGLDRDAVVDAAASFSESTMFTGQLAEDFELPLRDGSTFHLADHIGREVIVLNFFATWCQPCRAEMPELQRYAGKTGAGLVLLGVDAREPADLVDAFVRELNVTFPVAIDQSGTLQRRFEVTAYPTTVVIGADGRVVMYRAGAIQNADVSFDAIVPAQIAALTGSGGGAREDYLAAMKTERRTAVPPARSSAQIEARGLTGRALAIAEAMPCPCGCADLKVIACECQTAKAIKQKLREGVDEQLGDGKVMESLNKEFCMKGM